MSLERRDLQEGFNLIRQRRLEEAREFFYEALRLNPDDADAHFGLGCVYAAMGEKDKAVEEWRRCLELDPAMGEAHYALAWAYYDAGDYETGFRHVEMAYSSGVSLQPLKELFNLFVKTGKPIAERVEEPEKREKAEPTKDLIIHVVCSIALFILCYFLLKGTLHEGYPHDYLDATVAFYIAKIRILLSNGFRLYTPVWYFGYELLRFYPPLSTIIPYIAVRLTGNLLTTYYTLCLIYYAIYVIGTYLFASRFLSSQIAGFLAAVIWSITHANVVSFQGHYWETARLMGTALVPWVLYFVERALAEGGKRYMVASIITASYVLLSSMFSAIDLLVLLIPFLLIRGGLAPHDPEPERYSVPNRMGRLIIWGVEGLLGLTLWWYLPALLPHGIGVFLSVGKGRPPPLTHVLFQLHPPSWMTGIQLPITLLGLIGALLTIILQDRRGATPTIWFLSTTAIAYIIGLQSVRLILNIGFSLALLSAYTIKALEKQVTFGKKGMGRWVALSLVILIGGFLLYTYLPTYASYAMVDDTYRTTDEYLTATWLADHLNDSYRVYVMYGDNYRGTQWLNTFEPDVKQVLGGFDQGGRAMSLEPFIFDDLIKWGTNSTEAYKKAIEHGVKYIVIDRRWMLRNSPNAYDKFSDKRLFRTVNSINDKLSYAEVYEVINATPIKNEEAEYTYWDIWRIIGLISSFILTFSFLQSIIKSDLKIGEKEKIEKHENIKLRKLEIKINNKFFDIAMYLLIGSLTILIIKGCNALFAFPAGCDAYAHLYKVSYIIKYFPNHIWNYQWDCGVPIFGGTYPPISYYILSLFVKVSGLSIEFSMNIISTLSIIILFTGIGYLIYTLTNSRLLSILCIALIIYTPSFWIFWFIGGNYARVISMGFIGLSLYICSLIYIRKKKHPILTILLLMFIALSITTHLIGGSISLILVAGFIFFKEESILDSIKSIIKFMIFLLPLNAFYITQIFYSNPNRSSSLIGGISYNPANWSYLIYTPSYHDLNFLIIPLFILSLILSLKYTLNYGREIRALKISSLILFFVFLIYGYIGHLKFYPKNLYINGFLPKDALSMASIGGSIYISLSLLNLLNIIKSKFNKNILILILILILISFGSILELPLIGFNIKNINTIRREHDEPELLNILKLHKGELQYRVGINDASIALWFNYFYDTPQTRDYYSQGVPYPIWHGWFEYFIWNHPNDNESLFLLDWYAVKWIITYQNGDKFISNNYELISEYKYWYEFEYLNASKILTATDATPILFIGSDIYYDAFLRALSLTGLRSDLCIPVRGPSRYVDSYSLEELRRFPAVILYGYDYRDLSEMSQLLSAYVAGGGCLFLEANGSPDYKAENLPDPFPVRETHTYAVMDDWSFNVSNHPISGGVNFTAFAPPLYGGGGWGVSTSYEIADWAEPILMSGGRPLIVAGEYGKGRVVWSGMNLFYHAKSYRNEEEVKFISRILTWLRGVGGRDTPKHEVEFVNPQRRIVQLKERAGGILFKENYFKQWHAALEDDGKREKLRIYLAGPGLMYIPLPMDVEAGSRVVLWYELLPVEKLGYIMSITSLAALIIIAWRKPGWLMETNRDQEMLHQVSSLEGVETFKR